MVERVPSNNEPPLNNQTSNASGGWGWDSQVSGVSNGAYDVGVDYTEIEASNDKGYKIVEVKSFTNDVLERIEELKELYDFENTDPLIIIARHYKWSQLKMENWFAEQETLQYELGVEFDTRLVE